MIHSGPNKRKRDHAEQEVLPLHHTQFNAMLARIKQAKEEVVPAALREKIAQDDLNQLLNYFDDRGVRARTRAEKNRLAHIEAIKNIAPNSAYRLSKEHSGLPRSLSILRDRNGDYLLIAETKSKLSNNQKTQLPSVGGAYKKGKSAWRIDGYQEYFNLVTILETEDDESSLIEEVNYSNLVDSPYINHLLMGPCFNKGDKTKVSVYSEKALGNLDDLISKHILTRAQRLDIIGQLLAGLKHMHDNNLVHQDIRLENVLVYLTSAGDYRVKLSDFGNTEPHGKRGGSCATANYASPELVQYYQQPGTAQFEYFEDLKKYACYGLQPNGSRVFRHLQNPDKQNDIWAMGVLIFYIMHGTFPEFSKHHCSVRSDPLINGMLGAERATRFTIDQAIACFDETRGTERLAHRLK